MDTTEDSAAFSVLQQFDMQQFFQVMQACLANILFTNRDVQIVELLGNLL